MSAIDTSTYAATTTTTNNSAAVTNSSQTLGKNDFLQLLMTQMQNQDPTAPMDDTQSIAQLAQFSSLEQMQNINSSTLATQANEMIGRNVTWTDTSGTTQTGQVTSATFSSTQPPALVVNTGGSTSVSVALASVTAVSASNASNTATT